MDLELIALPAGNGETMHLAYPVGYPRPDTENLFGPGLPIGKTVRIERGQALDGVDVHQAMNDVLDRGWTVFGTGFVV